MRNRKFRNDIEFTGFKFFCRQVYFFRFFQFAAGLERIGAGREILRLSFSVDIQHVPTGRVAGDFISLFRIVAQNSFDFQLIAAVLQLCTEISRISDVNTSSEGKGSSAFAASQPTNTPPINTHKSKIGNAFFHMIINLLSAIIQSRRRGVNL